MSFCHMRIARPVSELDTTASMYCDGLGLELLGSFTDHEGFSGIMLGVPEAGWHHDGRFNLLDLVRMTEIEQSAELAAQPLASYAD